MNVIEKKIETLKKVWKSTDKRFEARLLEMSADLAKKKTPQQAQSFAMEIVKEMEFLNLKTNETAASIVTLLEIKDVAECLFKE